LHESSAMKEFGKCASDCCGIEGGVLIWSSHSFLTPTWNQNFPYSLWSSSYCLWIISSHYFQRKIGKCIL